MENALISSFRELRARWGGVELVGPAQINEIARVIAYLRRHGTIIADAADVFAAIQSLIDEEELTAYRCLEGVAVSHASNGWWLLFPHGSVKATERDPSDRSSLAFGNREC